MQQQLDISQTTAVTCDECGHTFFEQVLHLRKASGFLTGTGKDTFVPIPVFACKKCGHINQEFLPKEVEEL
jgi:DNA-directed RNA polymerase subunit M/transcription elongation factor TFIIS